MPVSDAMTQALAAVLSASDAKAAKAVEDFKATLPPPVDPQAAVDEKDAEDVAAVQALATQLTPASA